jgi:hypothetical protein
VEGDGGLYRSRSSAAPSLKLIKMEKILKLIAFIFIILGILMVNGCKTYDGCWKGAEPKFRYNTTKMRA